MGSADPGVRHPASLAVILAAVLLAAASLGRPFDATVSGVVGWDQYGFAARAFDRHGLGRATGAPPLYASADPRGAFVPYTHHPPLAGILGWFAWRSLGRTPAALRLPFLLATLAAAFALARLAARGGPKERSAPDGPTVAAVALSTPILVTDGALPDTMPIAILAGLLALWAHEACRGTSGVGRRGRLHRALSLLAASLSWYSYGLALALALERLAGPRAGRARDLVRIAAPWVAGFALVALWMAIARGGIPAMMGELRFLVSTLVGADAAVTHPAGFPVSYPRAMGSHLLAGFGPAHLLLALAGGWAILARGEAPERRLFRVLLVFGTLPQLLFWSRAALHPFFMLLLAPAVALAAASGLAACARRWPGPRTGPLLLVAVSLLGLAQGFLQIRSRTASAPLELAQELNLRVPASANLLLPVADYRGGLRYGTQAHLVPVLATESSFARLGGPEIAADALSGVPTWLAASADALPSLEWLRPAVDAGLEPQHFEVGQEGCRRRFLVVRLDPEGLRQLLARAQDAEGR
jgi:hypothetical protein